MDSIAEGMTLAPQWLAHRYSHSRDAIQFLDTPRASRAAAPFLTDAHLGDLPSVSAEREAAMRVAPPPAPLHFIFHSAFCCSTLLAKALDIVGVASTLKEPVLLNDLIGWRHSAAPSDRLRDLLPDFMRLLARPFEDGETMIVKPSNLINELAGEMLAAAPAARAVFIEAPLAEFVASIAAKGLEGRLWVRNLLSRQLKGGMVRLGFSGEDLFGQTDLQVAAVGWLVQRQHFMRLAEALGDRIVLTTSAELLRDPVATLSMVAHHFRLPLPEGHIAAVVGRVFAFNSKSGQVFGAVDRDQANRRALEQYGDEIQKVVAWTEAVAATAGVAVRAGSFR